MGSRCMIAHARDPALPPSQVRADVPEDLERVVLRCLAKDPADASRTPRAWSGPWASALRRRLGPEHAARWWRDIDAGDPRPIRPVSSSEHRW